MAEADWDEMARTHGGAPPAEGMDLAMAALLKRLQPTDSVLDVGCGSGPVVRAIANHVASVHGIDKSQAMLAKANENAPPNATFSLQSLDTYEGTHSVVVLFNVLHHLDTEATFAAIKQRLAPGGLLFVFEARHAHHGRGEHDAHTPFTPETFRATLDVSGFQLEAFQEVGAGAWAAARN